MKSVGTLFSGAGGFDHYFHDRFHVKFANDIRDYTAETYAKNHKVVIDDKIHPNETTYVVNDIANVDFNNNDVDCLIGGPPCQDFSAIRGGPTHKGHGITVKRGKLYLQYCRALKETNAKVFVFENVEGLMYANNGLAYPSILNDLSQRHTILFSGLTYSYYFGVAQTRPRLIIIGAKISKENEYKYKRYVNNVLSGNNSIFKKFPMTSIEVLEGKVLTELQDRYTEIIKQYENLVNDTTIPNMKIYKTTEWDKLSFNIIQDYLHVNNINDESNFSEAMIAHKKILDKLHYHKRIDPEPNKVTDFTKKMITYMPFGKTRTFLEHTDYCPVYKFCYKMQKKLHPLKPANTILTDNRKVFHYDMNRDYLTSRELARLQSFPDDFIFNGKTVKTNHQIGEAVSSLVGETISQVVSNILHDKIYDISPAQMNIAEYF